MDKADLRRGKPTVCNKWDDNTAILSGDTMLTLATQLVVDGVEPQKAMRLLKEFNETAIGVYEGQQYDMEFEARTDVTIDEYMEMIRLKTSMLCMISQSISDWRSNCRTTGSTCMAIPMCLARLSAAI